MDEKDIDLYLRAKDKWSLGNITVQISLVALGLAFVAAFVPALSEYVKYLLLFAFVAGASVYGAGSRGYVSRKDLLALLERQINSNPELILMASRRGSSGGGR